MNRPRLILLCAAASLLTIACAGTDAPGDIVADPADALTVRDEDDWAGTVEATVTGATPLSGSYRSTGAGCVRTPRGWEIAHESDADLLARSQAVLEDFAGNAASRVSLTLVFAESARNPGGMLLLGPDGLAPPGFGSANVSRAGDDMTVTIEGRTAEGVQIRATYRCLALE